MSNPPSADPKTLAFYAASAVTYTSNNKAKRRQRILAFLCYMPPGSRILELGCGGGYDAKAILDAGFEVDATDGTPEIAAEAEKRLGRPVRVMRFDELDADEAYEGVWAQASLLHVPRVALPGILERVYKALKPGGVHVASYKAGEAEGRDGQDRYFNYFSKEELADIYARSAAWEIVKLEELIGTGYEGEEIPWLAITVRKQA